MFGLDYNNHHQNNINVEREKKTCLTTWNDQFSIYFRYVFSIINKIKYININWNDNICIYMYINKFRQSEQKACLKIWNRINLE